MTEPVDTIIVEVNETTFSTTADVMPGSECILHFSKDTQIVFTHGDTRTDAFLMTRDLWQPLYLSKSEETPAEQHAEETPAEQHAEETPAEQQDAEQHAEETPAEQPDDTPEFLKTAFRICDPAEIPAWQSVETTLPLAFEMLRLRPYLRKEYRDTLPQHLGWVLSRGANVHCNGQTLLHYACRQNVPLTLDLVRLLLEAGCTPEKKDQNGRGRNALSLVACNRAMVTTPHIRSEYLPDEVLDLLVTPGSVRDAWWYLITDYARHTSMNCKLHDALYCISEAMTSIARLHELLTRCAQYRERRDA